MDTFGCFVSFVTDNSMSIPVGEVFFFVLVETVLLLLGRHKTGLIVTLCFVIYWGFFLNFESMVNVLGATSLGIPLYIFSGVCLVALVLVGSFVEADSR